MDVGTFATPEDSQAIIAPPVFPQASLINDW